MVAKILQFSAVNAAPSRAVTVVRDWPAADKSLMLKGEEEVVDLGIVRLKGAAARAWQAWADGLVHEMPRFDIDKKDYRQYVAGRLRIFEDALKRAKDSTEPSAMETVRKYPEHHALRWSHAEVHLPSPVFIPGYHEQNSKRERQRRFWDAISRGEDLREWPEYQSLARAAGFLPDEALPVIKVQRPYLPQPRQTASKSTKRGYRRLQERWEAAYGPGRKLIVNALKRKRREMLNSGVITTAVVA